ncbi:hypothetical protein SAMN04488539_0029 [Corynebacterium timonense]|uniref:Uncharacterized protein n=1 Tax=Corynebacterium timonense TaxID=441500 RepID=A0A1H1L2X5_9CORY|nr:hypothetical protein SAMN04488539_0029 [Corynebacterium timonense]
MQITLARPSKARNTFAVLIDVSGSAFPCGVALRSTVVGVSAIQTNATWGFVPGKLLRSTVVDVSAFQSNATWGFVLGKPLRSTMVDVNVFGG